MKIIIGVWCSVFLGGCASSMMGSGSTRTVVYKHVNPQKFKTPLDRENAYKIADATCRNYASQASAGMPQPQLRSPVFVDNSIRVGGAADFSRPAVQDFNATVSAGQAGFAMGQAIAARENAMLACMAQNGLVVDYVKCGDSICG